MSDTNGESYEATEQDVQRLLATFDKLLHGVRPMNGDSELRERVTAHLGMEPDALPSVSERLTPPDHVNLQLAIEAHDGDTEVIGLNQEVSHYHGANLTSLVSGRFRGPDMTAPVTWIALPTDVGETHRCAHSAIWLTSLDGKPLVASLLQVERGPMPELLFEAMAADEETAESFLGRVAELRHELNVFRGKTLAFSFSEHGQFGLDFVDLPKVGRDEVILPEEDLAAIERHTIGISSRAQALLDAGQHLKRGLLMYGPPGTGKTHTISYLTQAMPGRTTIILQGASSYAIGQAAAIARSFPPATIVIEDVDLVAHDRGMPGMGDNPILFQLLNEMDGLADDTDLLFILTSNRPEVLEPALAARPGRVDQAVEIGKPNKAALVALLDLYLSDLEHSIGDLDAIADRLDGVTASFVKELSRRALLRSIENDCPLDQDCIDDAVTDLLEHSAPVTRTSLGAADPPDHMGGMGGPSPFDY